MDRLIRYKQALQAYDATKNLGWEWYLGATDTWIYIGTICVNSSKTLETFAVVIKSV